MNNFVDDTFSYFDLPLDEQYGGRVLETAAVRTPVTVEENIQRGTEAMKRVISGQVNEPRAMFRKDLGWIAFYWGTPGKTPPEHDTPEEMLAWWTGLSNKFGLFAGGSGVSHIIAKRDWEGKYISEFLGQKGVTVALKLVDVIAKGKLITPATQKRVTIRLGLFDATLDKKYFKDDVVWLVSGMEIAGEYKLIYETADEPSLKVTASAYAHQNFDYRNDVGAARLDASTLPLPPDNVKPILEASYDWRAALDAATTIEDINAMWEKLFQVKAKEPWEMTVKDYLKKENLVMSDFAFLGVEAKKQVRLEAGSAIQEHKKIVKQALSEGKPVPAEVMADYPDLQSKASEPENTAFYNGIDAPFKIFKQGDTKKWKSFYKSDNGLTVVFTRISDNKYITVTHTLSGNRLWKPDDGRITSVKDVLQKLQDLGKKYNFRMSKEELLSLPEKQVKQLYADFAAIGQQIKQGYKKPEYQATDTTDDDNHIPF